MKADKEPNSRRVARTLGLLAFVFMSIVAVVVYSTEDDLTMVDYLMILCAPFISAVLFYLVGLYHDPKAND
jgi:hypothetical protein